MVIKREITVVNPHGRKPRKTSKKRATAKRRNASKAAPAATKEKVRMAKTKKRRSTGTAKRRNPSATSRKRRARRNPVAVSANPRRTVRRRTVRTRSRRNPTRAVRAASGLAREGLTALVALVATRQLPQMILGANNTGWIGYASNVAAAVATAFAARKVAGEDAYRAALIGGACYTVSRVLTEQLSPIGQYLSLTGIGDAAAATSLGTIEDAFMPNPTLYNDNGTPYIPPAYSQAAIASMPSAKPAAAMSGLERYAAY